MYPIETLLGVGAAGAAEGAIAALRAVGGAIVRQVVPKQTSPIDAAIQASRNSTNAGLQLEGEVAQHIKNAGIDIVSMNREIGPGGSVGEVDIETQHAIIEVTSSPKNKLGQIQKLINNTKINPIKKRVILYAPNYGRRASEDIDKAGGFVVHTPGQLTNLLRLMENP